MSDEFDKTLAHSNRSLPRRLTFRKLCRRIDSILKKRRREYIIASLGGTWPTEDFLRAALAPDYSPDWTCDAHSDGEAVTIQLNPSNVTVLSRSGGQLTVLMYSQLIEWIRLGRLTP